MWQRGLPVKNKQVALRFEPYDIARFELVGAQLEAVTGVRLSLAQVIRAMALMGLGVKEKESQ
jgi:hypothetical protein